MSPISAQGRVTPFAFSTHRPPESPAPTSPTRELGVHHLCCSSSNRTSSCSRFGSSMLSHLCGVGPLARQKQDFFYHQREHHSDQWPDAPFCSHLLSFYSSSPVLAICLFTPPLHPEGKSTASLSPKMNQSCLLKDGAG